MGNLKKIDENELTLNQLLFIDEYFSNGRDAKLAYKAVYKATTEGSIKVGVAKLLKNPKVKEAIINSNEQFLAKNKLDIDEIINNIKKIEEKARIDGKASDALRANELLARLAGAFEPPKEKNSSSNKPMAIQINIQAPTVDSKVIDIDINNEPTEEDN